MREVQASASGESSSVGYVFNEVHADTLKSYAGTPLCASDRIDAIEEWTVGSVEEGADLLRRLNLMEPDPRVAVFDVLFAQAITAFPLR